MTTKKPAPSEKSKPKKKAGKQAPSGTNRGFFRFLLSTPMRQLLLIAIIVILLSVFWSNITDAFGNLLDTLGLGLFIIIAAIITLIILYWQRKLGLLLTYWNRWLGGIAFILAFWGILASLNYAGAETMTKGLGGSFGRDIIDFRNFNFIYGLRILALVIIGIVFIW